MRKIFRKVLSVVAAAAVCCGIMTPVTVNAAECTHENMFLGMDSKVVGGNTHSYGAYVNGVPVTRACSVTITEYWYINSCSCGYSEKITGIDAWREETHSAASDPYHN